MQARSLGNRLLQGTFWHPIEPLLFAACFYRPADEHALMPTVPIMMGLHFLWLGLARWQILPLYAALLLKGWTRRGSWLSLSAPASLALLSLTLSALVPRLLPLPPRGPYKVATVVEHVRIQGAQEFVMQVFYPVDRSAISASPFFPAKRKAVFPGKPWAKRVPFRHSLGGLVAAGATSLVQHKRGVQGSEHLIAQAAVLGCLCLACDVYETANRLSLRYPYVDVGGRFTRSLARCLKMPQVIWSHMSLFDMPALDGGLLHGAKPCFPMSKSAGPVVLWLHGLLGGRSMYSMYAAELAANGCVVFCPEHTDGSAVLSVLPDGTEKHYETSPHKALSDEERHWRGQQLEARVAEVGAVIDEVDLLASGENTQLSHLAQVGGASIVDSSHVVLMGHSFGGTTAVEALCAMQPGGKLASHSTKLKATILLDPWTFPLSDKARALSIQLPLLIASNKSFLGEEGRAREAALAAAATAQTLRLSLENSHHQNMSDAGLFSPELARRTKAVGPCDPLEFTDNLMELIISMVAVHARGGGTPRQRALASGKETVVDATVLFASGGPPSVADTSLKSS
ncbi:unnamed protein product [Chrysoparadoxa australica]